MPDAPKKPWEAVGAKIKVLREILKVTQVELAERLETTQSNVAKWERGDYKPSPVQLVRIARLAGKRPEATFFYEEAGLPERFTRGTETGRHYSQEGYMDAERVLHDLSKADPTTSAYENEIEDIKYSNRFRPISSDRNSEAVPSAPLDQDLLVFSMEMADAELERRRRTLRRREYAKLVALICDFCHRSGTRDPGKVEALFKTARSAIHILEPGPSSDETRETENSQGDRGSYGHIRTGKK